MTTHDWRKTKKQTPRWFDKMVPPKFIHFQSVLKCLTCTLNFTCLTQMDIFRAFVVFPRPIILGIFLIPFGCICPIRVFPTNPLNDMSTWLHTFSLFHGKGFTPQKFRDAKHDGLDHVCSRKLTHPTLGKGTSLSNMPWVGN